MAMDPDDERYLAAEFTALAERKLLLVRRELAVLEDTAAMLARLRCVEEREAQLNQREAELDARAAALEVREQALLRATLALSKSPAASPAPPFAAVCLSPPAAGRPASCSPGSTAAALLSPRPPQHPPMHLAGLLSKRATYTLGAAPTNQRDGERSFGPVHAGDISAVGVQVEKSKGKVEVLTPYE